MVLTVWNIRRVKINHRNSGMNGNHEILIQYVGLKSQLKTNASHKLKYKKNKYSLRGMNGQC
jgi:hypothetical protein